jgi:hypothetical protein
MQSVLRLARILLAYLLAPRSTPAVAAALNLFAAVLYGLEAARQDNTWSRIIFVALLACHVGLAACETFGSRRPPDPQRTDPLSLLSVAVVVSPSSPEPIPCPAPQTALSEC